MLNIRANVCNPWSGIYSIAVGKKISWRISGVIFIVLLFLILNDTAVFGKEQKQSFQIIITVNGLEDNGP